jgi:hypothetical protein
MDFADASLTVAPESLRTTLDRDEFATYRARIGRTLRDLTVLGPYGDSHASGFKRSASSLGRSSSIPWRSTTLGCARVY